MSRPALRFLAAGALLFATVQWLAPPPPSVPWSPGGGDDEALLLREALALGLDDSRPVRGWLAQVAATLALADGADAERLLDEARAVGLDRSDAVVRRHLADLVRLAAATSRTPPDDAALRAYLGRHAARFALSARVRLTQVFLSARRGAAARAEADTALARLRAGDDPIALGDPLGHAGTRLGPLSQPALARRLGAQLAAAVFAVPDDGVWHGPLPSAYGWHLVRIDGRLPAEVPDLPRVRSRVLHAYLRDQGAAQLAGALAALRRPDPPPRAAAH